LLDQPTCRASAAEKQSQNAFTTSSWYAGSWKLAAESTKWNMKSFLLSACVDEVARIDKRGLFPLC
jgi:hypothetical protein